MSVTFSVSSRSRARCTGSASMRIFSSNGCIESFSHCGKRSKKSVYRMLNSRRFGTTFPSPMIRPPSSRIRAIQSSTSFQPSTLVVVCATELMQTGRPLTRISLASRSRPSSVYLLKSDPTASCTMPLSISPSVAASS